MNNKQKKILFIYSNLADGGTQSQLSILSKYLCENNEVYIALFKNEQLFPFHGKIIDLKAPTTKNPILLIYYIFKRIFKINSLSKKLQPDIIISLSVIANMCTLISKSIFFFKTPIIITFENSLIMNKKGMGFVGRIALILNKLLSNKAAKIIAVSKDLKKELIQYNFSSNKIITLYNGIDISLINQKKIEDIEDEYKEFFNTNYPIITTVGRLSEQKNHKLLLDAFNLLNKNIKTKLVIIGDGPKKNELISYCKQLGIESNVLFTGWVKNPYKFLNRSDIFVLSSLWEGLGIVIIEALAIGLPVISTDCPTGPGEIITNEMNGILVPINDPYKLSNAIERVLTNKDLKEKLIKNGLKRAKEFSIVERTKELNKIIDECI